MGRRNFLKLGAGTALVADAPAQARVRIVPGWNRLALQATLRAAGPAPAAARALATLHNCLYNAWAAYDDEARQTVQGVAVRLPRAERGAPSKASAMSHAAWLALRALFPLQQSLFDGQMARLGLDTARACGQLTPAGIGRTQAAAMLDAGRHAAAHAPPGPAQRAAAGAPRLATARWYRLARHVSERDGHDDDQDVLLYFVLANALADAADAAADAAPAVDAGPAYADSVCGGAAAAVLRSFTGSDKLAGAAAGAPHWPTFSAAAGHGARADGADAGEVAAGLELGRRIGAQAFDRARRYWQGKL